MAQPTQSIRADAAAALLKGELRGCPPDRMLRAVRTLVTAGPADASFLHNPKYLADARASGAGLILAASADGLDGLPLLLVKDPYRALAALLQAMYAPPAPAPERSERAVIDPSAEIDPSAAILPLAVIGPRAKIGAGALIHSLASIGADCEIGAGAVIYPGAVLYPETVVGARTIIHAGAVLGSDGFGFALGAGIPVKIPQIGRVRVGADCEIGANTTIDRAALGETVIEDGAKIDNLVQVAHNVVIGAGSVLAAQTGISGSTTLGAGVICGGQAAFSGHIKIGAGARIAGRTGIFNDVEPGAAIGGFPAKPQREWLRREAMIDRLPELRQQVKALEGRLAALEERGSGLGVGGQGSELAQPVATKPTRSKTSKKPEKKKPIQSSRRGAR
jgi:UDP-3-O-[3-hydroxymyristoyl] glucosamine N-acyltransferase